METRKNLCAMLPVALHTRVRQEQEKAGMTLGEYVEAMSAVVQQDWAQAQFHGYRVTAFVLGIAAGVSLTLSLFEMLLHAVRHAHAKKQR